MVRKLHLSLLLTLFVLLLSASAAAADKLGEKSFTATVNSVLVNRQGGITISGGLDCTSAVTSAFASLGPLSSPPATYAVLTGVTWDASQTVGRTKVVRASWQSGIAQPCYPAGPWATLYGFPVGGTQWVYSTNGKFVAGKIHVEINAGPGLTILGADGEYCGPGITISPLNPCDPNNADYYEAYAMSGWDVRATVVK